MSKITVEHKDLIYHLKNMYHNIPGFGGCYIAGTLILEINHQSVMLDFTNEELIPEEKLWLSLLYMKNKDPSCDYYPQARDIVESYPDKILAAKELLLLERR